MPTPFPGMAPYLERPELWPNVHNSLIIAIRDDLAPRVRPRYYVAVEERTVHLDQNDLLFAARPDVAVVKSFHPPHEPVAVHTADHVETVTVELPVPDAIRELYLEIREVSTHQVITVVEILSPTNKQVGEGRTLYERKRRHILATLSHLVEIDLLHTGLPMAMRGYNRQTDYRILVSHAQQRPHAKLYPFSVHQSVPAFILPLQADDADIRVDLNQILHDLYDRAGCDLRIDYRSDPDPPLSQG